MEIESNVAPPKQKRARRTKKDKQNPAEGLIRAIKFILPTQSKNDFCDIGNHWLIGECDDFKIGIRIEEDLICSPYTHKLLEALQQCKQELQITQLSETELSVKSGDFNSIIECAIAQQQEVTIEAFPINQAFFKSISDVYEIGDVNISLGCATASNGHVVVQSYHGIQGIAICIDPKVARLLSKDIYTKFNFNQTKVWFVKEDDSFIECYNKPLENIDEHPLCTDKALFFWKVPDNFKQAVEGLVSFSDDDILYFEEGGLKVTAANYKIEGLPNNISLHIPSLLKIIDHIKSFVVLENRIIFYGDNVRGAMALMTEEIENKIEE